ncbi:MAG: ABC transporter permease [Tepidiformaceae bacterium]
MPALVVVLLTLAPAWYLVVRATERGWGPWQEAFDNSAFPLLGRSIALAAAVSAASVAVALPAAWLTTRADLRFRRAWAVVLSLPLAIPSYVMALTVVAALGPRGILQDWLEPFGVEQLPVIYGFRGAALALTAVSFPYVFLVLRAALSAADPSLEEASRALGRGAWHTFLRISLPPLAPAVAAGVLLVALYALSDFGAVSTLRYNSFTTAIFIQYQSSFDRTGAAVLGVMLAAVTAVILAGELLVRSRSPERIRLRRQRPPRPVRLGLGQWPAAAFLAAVALFSLVLPVGVLAYWLVRGIAGDADFPALAAPVRHTLTASAGAAAITVVLALPIAILATRFAGVRARAIEQSAYLTHALPGLVVALALVFFGIRYATPLYQTVWLMLAAYVILFLPNALSALRSPLARQDRSLDDAAASLGRAPARVIATVTLPLARPGMAAAAALVFLTTMKELPATLLLSPPGYRTLPGIIWGASNDALFASAALPALLLIALAAIPVAFLAWRGDIESVDS